jgi:hypothetical protein
MSASISLTLTVTDIEDPFKRSATYSKTITLVGTERNMLALGLSNDLQSYYQDFDVGEKYTVIVRSNGVQIMTGVLRIIQATVTGGNIVFEAMIISEISDLFNKLQSTNFYQIDWSGFDHTKDATTIEATWVDFFSGTKDFIYPHLDTYGYPDVYNNSIFNLNTPTHYTTQYIPFWKFVPCVRIKTVLETILSHFGYTYESQYLKTDWKDLSNELLFPNLVMTFPTDPTSVGANLVDFQAFVGSSVGVPNQEFINLVQRGWTVDNFNLPNSFGLGSVSGMYARIPFNDEAGSFYDVMDIWNNTNYSEQTQSFAGDTEITYHFRGQYRNHSVDFTTVLYFTWYDTATGTELPQATNSMNYMFLVDPDTTAEVSWQGSFILPNYVNAYLVCWAIAYSNAYIIAPTDGEWLQEGLELTLEYKSALIANITGVQCVPYEQTLSDFFTDLQKTFNLMMWVDAEAKVLHLEPYDYYYDIDGVAGLGLVPDDWTNVVDKSKPIVIQPSDVTLKKLLKFGNAKGTEHLAKMYEEKVANSYGNRTFNTGNYYGQSEQTVQTSYGNIIPASYQTDFITGRTWSVNADGSVKEQPAGYKWGFVKSYTLPFNQTWRFVYGTAITDWAAKTKWIYIGHFNDPYTPFADLNFGLAREVYFRNRGRQSGLPIPTRVTDNNRFNENYWGQVNEVMGVTAMTIKVSAVLNDSYIYNLNFRKPVYFDGMLWRIIAITDYEVGGRKPCQVTLRRVNPIVKPDISFYDVILGGAVAITTFDETQTIQGVAPRFRNSQLMPLLATKDGMGWVGGGQTPTSDTIIST